MADRAFETEFRRLTGLGYPANRCAALLMPILLTGANPTTTAESALQQLRENDGETASGMTSPSTTAEVLASPDRPVTMLLPPLPGTPSAAASNSNTAPSTASSTSSVAPFGALPEDIASIMTSFAVNPPTSPSKPSVPALMRAPSTEDLPGITFEEVRNIVHFCREAKDYTELIRYVGKHFASISSLRKSFLSDSGVPELDLGGSHTSSLITAAKQAVSTDKAAESGKLVLHETDMHGDGGDKPLPGVPVVRDISMEGAFDGLSAPNSDITMENSTANSTNNTSAADSIHVSGATSAAGAGKATPLSPFLSLPPCDIDITAAVSTFQLIINAAAEDTSVLNSLSNATKAAVDGLAASRRGGSDAAQHAPRVMMILAMNPAFEDPALHSTVLSFCKAYDLLSSTAQQLLSHWFATVGGGHALIAQADDPIVAALKADRRTPNSLLKTVSKIAESPEEVPIMAIKRSIDWCQQYVTVRLYQGPTGVDDIAAPVHWLKMLNDANEEYRHIHGVHAVPFTTFYNEVVSGEINLQDDFRRWMAERRGSKRPVFSFCANPFILDAAAKSIILQTDAEMQMSEHYREALFTALMSGGDRTPYFVLKIRRDHLLEDALQGIVSPEKRSSLKRPLKVQFQGEEGIDAGGVRREFFSLITRQLFTPDFGMFTEEPATRCLWFQLDSLEANIQFELVGALLGIAIYNGVILDVHFPMIVYRKLKKEHVSLRDLDDFKPDIGRNLRAILDYDGADFEDVFALDFSVTYEAWGVKRTVELVPGGCSKVVTKDNRKAYVHAYLKWLLVDSIAQQFDAFARGFNGVAAGPALDLFRPEELARLITGSEELDFNALEAATHYEEPYTADHASIRDFWSILHTFDAEDRRKFLAFVSGSDRAPIRGLGDLRMVIQRAGPDSDRLPTASTCFYTLLLPEYASREKMEGKLRAAMQESQGFGLM